MTLTGEFRNFRICLCLEIGSKPEEAIPYCQKAISTCRSRVRRLMLESRSFSESTTSSSVSVLEPGVTLTSNVTESDNNVTDKQAEIETLTELSGDLEKKVSNNFFNLNFKIGKHSGLYFLIFVFLSL